VGNRTPTRFEPTPCGEVGVVEEEMRVSMDGILVELVDLGVGSGV
jgi:hypothetical protein